MILLPYALHGSVTVYCGARDDGRDSHGRIERPRQTFAGEWLNVAPGVA